MIKSLKGTNGSWAKLGNPQVQPQTDDIAYGPKKGSITPSSQDSTGTPPPHQTGISTPIIKHNGDELEISNNASLADIVGELSSNPDFILPPYHSITNNLSPAYAKQLEPAKVHFDTSLALVGALSSKKLELYEEMTGISHERPEIVMLTNFLPLFTKDVSHAQPSFYHQLEGGGIYPFMTDAGHFVDTHINARAMQRVNMSRMLRVMVSSFNYFYGTYKHRRNRFEKQMDALKGVTNFLLEMVRTMEKLKGQLDLRDDLHSVDPHRVSRQHISNFTSVSKDVTSVLLNLIKLYMPSSYTVPDTLVTLGFKRDNIDHRYSSTKIWLQLMHEMKQIVQHHSLEFLDIDPVYARNDNKAARMSKTSASLFGLKQQLPNTPRLIDIAELSPNKVEAMQIQISTAWKTMYRNVHFKTTEANVAALINFVSKEFRCSYGLGRDDVKNALKNYYDYAVTSNDNSDVFESIIGPIGNSITDFPLAHGKSLAAVAQRTPAPDVSVMTFESKYIDGDTGTLVPGAQHFIDQVLKTDGKSFDTSRLDNLGDIMEHAHTRFSTVVEGMNLLATHVSDPQDFKHTQYSSFLSNPADFIRAFVDDIVNIQTGQTLGSAKSDNMGAIYAYAATHSSVKTTLFLYTMAKIMSPAVEPALFFDIENGPGAFTSSDNSPLINKLVNKLVSELEGQVPHSQTGNQFVINDLFNQGNFPSVSKETIRNALKGNGTKLTRHIEDTMKHVLRSFKNDRDAMINHRTRWNGYQDTVIAMMVFDALIQMVAKYNNQDIISQNHGLVNFVTETVTFNVSRTNISHKTSINDLLTRIEKEVALTQRVIYSALNTLQQLSSATKNYSNYLKSPPAIAKLRQLSSIIGNQQLLQMLMSEQQIMMLAATVHDLSDKISQPGAVVQGSRTEGDVDGDGDFDVDDEFKLLDDAVVLPRLRKAIYGLFGTKEYALQKGFNKRLLTVGIPAGFTQRLKQRVKLSNLKKSSFVDKQSDIVNVVVYRVDVENSDIIYKPQRFMFELSRFPVRNDRYFLAIPEHPTIDDIVQSIPTRDFSQNAEQNTEITYWSHRDDVSKGKVASFANESYAFLSRQEKAQIAQNHVISYLLEVYINLLTGLSVADYHFDMEPAPKPMDAAFTKMLVDHYVAHSAKQSSSQNVSSPEDHPESGGVLFTSTTTAQRGYVASNTSATSTSQTNASKNNSSGIIGEPDANVQFQAIGADPVTKTMEQQKAIGTTSSNLGKISARSTASVVAGLRTISGLSHTVSPLADPLAVSKKLVTPKQFDRVLNIPIDPDDFEIDYDKTVKTPHGKQALHHMILKGDIITNSENESAAQRLVISSQTVTAGYRVFPQGRTSANIHSYRRRTRDKNQGDLTLDKYFVTIETFGEEDV